VAPSVGAGGSEFRKLDWQLRREAVRCLVPVESRSQNGNPASVLTFSEAHPYQEEHAMMKYVVVALMSLSFALPVFGETYKSTYPISCGEVWGGVKDTLSNPQNYTVVKSDDAKMTASYHVKHAVHVTITGAVLQRKNKVTLVSKGPACEMQVVSNYSGFEHNDREDFKKRVDDSLAKLKAAKPSEPAKPADAPK
jgi:hypothetical protein